MVSQTVTITNEQGIHMRPASVLSQAAAGFASSVTLVHDGKTFDAKSVIALMSSALKCGFEIEVQCEGPDEAEALKKTVEIIESGMGD